MAFVFVHCVIGSNGDHKATRQNVAIQVTANDTIENNNVLLRVPKSDDNDYDNRCNDTVEKKQKRSFAVPPHRIRTLISQKLKLDIFFLCVS